MAKPKDGYMRVQIDLSPGDKTTLERIAEEADLTEADVMRDALRQFTRYVKHVNSGGVIVYKFNDPLQSEEFETANMTRYKGIDVSKL